MKMSADGGKKKRQDDDEIADFSDDGTNKNKIAEIKKRREALNKIRCQRYRDNKKETDEIVSSQIYEEPTSIIEEEERIKRRKECDKQRSQRYRDKKRASNLIKRHTDHSSKTVVRHVSKCQNFHYSQIVSTRNVPYVPPIYTSDQLTRNEPYIPESHSDYDNNIHIDLPSQVNYVPPLHEPIITNYVPNTPNIFPMSSDGGKRKLQDDDEGVDFSDDGTSQTKIAEIKKRMDAQNKIRCQRYRDNKKETDEIVSSQIYEEPTSIIEEEEKIKRRKECDKQRSQRYRDKKRASNLIKRHTDHSSKTVVRHVSKCQIIHNSQIAGPSTGSVPYISPIYTADLSIRNESFIPGSHSDYDIHIDHPSQVNYVPQLHEPILTNYVPNTPNIFVMSSDGGKRKGQDDDEGVNFSDDVTSQNKIAEIKKRREALNKIRCQRYRDKKKRENDEIVSSQNYDEPTSIAEEEERIKRRKECDKQRSQRYRDKKRASNLIKRYTDHSSKTVVRHVSKYQNVHNSQIAGPLTRNVPYVPPIYTADLLTRNEPYIPESHSDYDNDIHIDLPSQVNYVPQLRSGGVTMELNIPPPKIKLDDDTDIRIKDESETLNEDNIEIKTETHEDNVTYDNPFKDIQLEVKQEFVLTFEKESTDSQSDDQSQPPFENNDKFNTEENFSVNADLQEEDKLTANSNLECIKDELKQEDSIVSFDYPNFDDTRSMDSDDVAALSHVEACLQDEFNFKQEHDGFQNNPKEEFPDIEVKNESDYVTETHLISNKVIQTTSTITHPQDGLIESQTTNTLVMEILNVSGKEDLSKMGNPEEILPTCTNYENCNMEYDNFQLNSITGNVLTLEQEAYGLLKAKKKKHDPIKKNHECPKCSKSYSQKRELERHLRVHASIEKRAQGVIKGQKTRKENRNKKIKEEEKKEKVKKGGYECTCGEVFLRRSRMETCLRSHNMLSVISSYPCMTCKRQFKDKEELALHRKRLHRKRFPCKFCPTNYDTRKELFKHLQVHQKVQLTEYKVISEAKGKQKLKCFMCSKTYSEIQDLKSHVMEDHNEPYSCPRCKLKFPKIIDFGNHTKTYHPEIARQDVLDVLEAFSMLVQAWKCEECGLQFHEADKLALHQIEKHSPDVKVENQFQCTDCRRVFISQKGLTSHRRVHHSIENVEDTVAVEQGVMCLECRKMCKDMIALTSHMRFHSPERKYPCKFCDFRFATPEKRKTHAEIHTGDMKFVCFICEYQCSSENRLKHHKMSLKHLNMKEYLLTGKPLIEEEQSTSKQEKIKDTLKKKEWGVKKRKKEKDRKEESEKVEEIEVACDICGDKFPSESVMLEHKQTHPFIEFPNDDKPSRIFFK